jgi:hypothetical protein
MRLLKIERREFFLGKQVNFFDYASKHTEYPTPTIFQFADKTLIAGIDSIESTGSGALRSFMSRSKSLAVSLKADKIEFVGAQ